MMTKKDQIACYIIVVHYAKYVASVNFTNIGVHISFLYLIIREILDVKQEIRSLKFQSSLLFRKDSFHFQYHCRTKIVIRMIDYFKINTTFSSYITEQKSTTYLQALIQMDKRLVDTRVHLATSRYIVSDNHQNGRILLVASNLPRIGTVALLKK